MTDFRRILHNWHDVLFSIKPKISSITKFIPSPEETLTSYNFQTRRASYALFHDNSNFDLYISQSDIQCISVFVLANDLFFPQDCLPKFQHKCFRAHALIHLLSWSPSTDPSSVTTILCSYKTKSESVRYSAMFRLEASDTTWIHDYTLFLSDDHFHLGYLQLLLASGKLMLQVFVKLLVTNVHDKWTGIQVDAVLRLGNLQADIHICWIRFTPVLQKGTACSLLYR